MTTATDWLTAKSFVSLVQEDLPLTVSVTQAAPGLKPHCLTAKYNDKEHLSADQKTFSSVIGLHMSLDC